MKTEKLQEILDNRFGGVLSRGEHDENKKACALEVLSVALGKTWTDDPDILRTYDLRSINDIYVADEIRTKHLLPVIAAYAGSLDWSREKQVAVVSKIVVLTVNRIISALSDLPENISVQCKNASTLDEAGRAAKAAGSAAVAEVAAAARWVATAVEAEEVEVATETEAEAVAEAEAAAAMVAAAAWTARGAEAATEVEAAAGQWTEAAAAAAATAATEAAAAAGRLTEAGSEKIFILACEIWMEALKEAK